MERRGWVALRDTECQLLLVILGKNWPLLSVFSRFTLSHSTSIMTEENIGLPY